jgi:15-cis-phytoene synthase
MTTLALTTLPPRAVIAHHSKSFALASKLLPATARDDAAVLYAWCRRADDLVDLDTPDRSVIDMLSDELTDAYAGRASDPLLREFGRVVRRRGIPRTYPRELLAGMAMDLDDTQYETLEDLIVYAWRVAGVVGLMMTHVLGIDDDNALIPAAHLGIAMQLTNICRDVAEDLQRGRVYIPRELARGGAPVRELLAVADRYYKSADRGLIALPLRASFGVASARDIYSAIGSRIAAQDYDVNAGRAIVSPTRKVSGVMRAAWRTLVSLPRRAVRRGVHRIPNRTLELSHVPRL